MAKDQKKQQTPPKINPNVFSGIQEELKQVTWPTRQETIELTATVITISLIVALYVGIIDVSLAKVLEIISQR